MRKRSDSSETPVVTSDASPHPRAGPITALRVLGQGFTLALPEDLEGMGCTIGRARPPATDVQLRFTSISRIHAYVSQAPGGILVSDMSSKNGISAADPWVRSVYHRCQRTLVHVGGRFALGDIGLLALDAATEQLTAAFTAYCGADAIEDVDRALEAAARGHMLVLDGARDDDLSTLARAIHHHSVRRDYPFTVVETMPSSPAAIARLCDAAGSGTIYLDLREPQSVPSQLARYLFSPQCYLRTIVVALSPLEVVERFGAAFLDRPERYRVCTVGFRRAPERDDVDFFS